MIFVRLKIEYFFLFLGFFCFVHRLFTENSSVTICGCIFVSYFFDFEGFQLSTVNCQYVGVMLVLCWCYVDLMLVLC